MNSEKTTWHSLVAERWPGLLGRIKESITAAEEKHEAYRLERADSFLWEHSTHTAALAFQISRREGIDPGLPVLAALLHDSGKFAEGGLHEGSTSEEEASAVLARDILSGAGLASEEIVQISSGLEALYSSSLPGNLLADIVHDADFLAKSGRLGVAAFFLKSALRGRALHTAVCRDMSKELTYASVLPDNMRIPSSRHLAERKKNHALSFYTGLIRELREDGIAAFHIEKVDMPCPFHPGRRLDLVLVLPESCGECGSGLKIGYSSELGVKCRKLIVKIRCKRCSEAFDIAFCLPEILC